MTLAPASSTTLDVIRGSKENHKLRVMTKLTVRMLLVLVRQLDVTIGGVAHDTAGARRGIMGVARECTIQVVQYSAVQTKCTTAGVVDGD